jgi:uncharacterized membrane protein
MARTKKVTESDLSPDQREALRKALSDYEGASNLDIINQNPEYFYFLAAKDERFPTHPQNVTALKRLGYEVVGSDNNDGEMMPHGTVKDASGGAIQTEEHVLMRLPKWLHDARQNKKMDLATSRSEAAQGEQDEVIERVASETGAEVVVFHNVRSRETKVHKY